MAHFTPHKFSPSDIITRGLPGETITTNNPAPEEKKEAIEQDKKVIETDFPVLPHETEESVQETANTKDKYFKVHKIVSDQLGLVNKEQIRTEQKIQKEIDRRWLEVKEKAEVEGYTKGLKEGKLEAYNAEKPRIEEKLKKLDSLLIAFDGSKKKIFSDNTDFLMHLLSQILRLVVLKEVAMDKNYLERLVINLIDEIGNKDDLLITISDIDAVNVKNLSEAIGQKFGELKNLKIENRPDINPGSCRVETRSVVIDAQLENQIKNAMKILTEGTSPQNS